MFVILYAVFWICVISAGYAWIVRPPRRIGRHRGTPGQLALQAEQRAEREAAHAQATVRAYLIANGVRADWVMVEG